MNNHFAEIGKRLSFYITSKGISQSKLARLSSTSASQIFNMLNGTKYGVDKLLVLFRALPDLNPEWLLFGNGPIERTPGTVTSAIDQLQKFASENQITGKKLSNDSVDINTSNRVAELQEKLDVCIAEKEGLEKIIDLKDEMIEMLKKQK